jgi:hypothetical protein
MIQISGEQGGELVLRAVHYDIYGIVACALVLLGTIVALLRERRQRR